MSLSLILLLGLALPSFAQDADACPGDPAGVQCVDFNTLNINGTIDGPSGTVVLERRQATFPPLIRLRTNFNRELEHTSTEI